MGSLEGRAALVTGAGHGIGRAIAKRYASEGARVLLIDIDAPAVEASAADIVAEGGRAEAMHVDVTSPEQVAAAVEFVVSTWGAVDVLCNNAGVMDGLTPLHHATLDDWHRIFETNATGPFLMCRAVIGPMLDAGCGAIVNIASVAGLQGGRAGVAYTASKHAVIGLTRNVAYTYADRNIRCNAICPGSVDTNIMVRDMPRDDEGLQRYRLSGGTMARRGERDEIATVAAFLASDAASFVNGAILPVDGGWITA